VEIPGPSGFAPGYAVLAGNGHSSLIYNPGDSRLQRAAGADSNFRQPTCLKLDYKVEGETVLITASLYFDEFDRQTTPVSLYPLPQTKVGVYSAKLHESVTLSGMAQFGLEPLTLKIVPAQTFTRPQTTSKAPSLRIEITGEDRMFYQVSVRNLSTQAVTAVFVDMPRKDGAGGLLNDIGTGDLIAPGATNSFPFGVPKPEPMPLMVLETAFFKDGSYEGDVPTAMHIFAQRTGTEIQRERINRLVEATLADTALDDQAKIARIRSESAQLTEDPDAPMIARVTSQFPGIPNVETFLKIGLNNEKQSIGFGLKGFEQNKSPGLTLAKWWSIWRKPQ
jgi:hypothetical protein